MSVEEFFKGKHILISGGSGFIGKVLIEKLLRSCEGIEKIYVLLRTKKNKRPEERLKIIFETALFAKLTKINPEAIKKVVPITGDVTKLNLGLSDEDTQCLINNMDIVYHSAASTRFDDHLKDSILLNTRGTREIIGLVLQAKKSVIFIHVSTAYSNSDKKIIEEKMYPAHADWRNTIKLAEEMDQNELNVFSAKYIYPFPNTYTFAKSLSEHVVNDLCQEKLIAAIVRPSIVMPTVDDPIFGWIDNYNGPIGLMAAGEKGILKVSYGDLDSALDIIPVDIFVKFLILIAYEKALHKDKNEVTVYNAAHICQVQLKDVNDYCLKLTWDVPYYNLLWYPAFSMTYNWYKYFFILLLHRMFPAIVTDGIIKFSGNKPMLTNIQRKVYIANMSLLYFMENTWQFANEKCLALGKHLTESDMQKFSFTHFLKIDKETVYSFFLKGKIGAGANIFKEELDIVKGYRHTIIYWILDWLLHLAVYGILGWFVVTKIEILNNYVNAYI